MNEKDDKKKTRKHFLLLFKIKEFTILPVMNLFKKFKKLFDPIDLSHGGIWKDILMFSFPIMLSTLLQKIYSLIDTIICGQTLPDAAVAAVTNTTNIVFLILQFSIGCASGFSVVLSKKIGQKSIDGARKSIWTQLVLSAIITVILSVVGCLVLDYLLAWIGIYPSTTDAYMQAEYEAAKTYLLIIVGTSFSQIFYNLAVTCTRAYGDSFTPFVFLMISTVLNIVLDLLFIVVFNWGVAGAAWATAAAQALAGLLSWIYLFYHYKELRLHKEDLKITWKDVLEHLKNGLPLAFNFSILSIGTIIMTGAVISFDRLPDGTMNPSLPAQLGYGVASKVITLAMGFQESLGLAMISFMAQNLGAGRQDRIKKGYHVSVIYGLIITVLINAILLPLTINGAYQYLFLSASKVTQESIKWGNAYLYTAVPMMFVLLMLFLFRNCLEGLEKAIWPFLAGIAELVARVLICSFLPSIINGGAINSEASVWAFVGVSLGDPGAWICATLTMIIPMMIAIYKPKINTSLIQQEKHDSL